MSNFYIYNMRSEQYLINHASDDCHDLWTDNYRYSDSCIIEGTLNYIEDFISMPSDTDPRTAMHVSAISMSMARAVALYIMNEEYCMVFPCITDQDGDITYFCPDFLRGEPIDYSQERLDYLRGKI